MRRKWLSLLLAAAMLCSLLPAASAAAAQLPTPEVEWLTEEKTAEVNGVAKTYKPGQALMSEVPTNFPGLQYHVTLKNTTNGETLEEYTEGLEDPGSGYEDIKVGWYANVLTEGVYNLTVYYVGDGETWQDSEPVTVSYTYTPPDAGTYAAPTGVEWADSGFAYTVPEEKFGPKDNLFIQFGYFKDDPDSTNPQKVRHRSGDPSASKEDRDAAFQERFNDFVSNSGDGYYRFRLRVVSDCITEKASSPWSEWSSARLVTGEPEDITEALEEIANGLDDTVTDEQKREAFEKFQALDQKELATALNADQNGTGVSAQLADLEEKLGLKTTVKVEEGVEGIDSAAVTVVGAGLNADDLSNPPAFTISPATDKEDLPEGYRNDVQLYFELTGVSGTTLKPPVQITMPVPEGLNPQRLRILHYQDGGNIEVIEPYVFQEGTRWMARFTVDSLSPFVFAEYKPFTVTFDANNGTGPYDSKETNEKGIVTDWPADPAWDGHTFLNWSTATEGGEPVTDAYVFTADATVYALWQENGGDTPGGGDEDDDAPDTPDTPGGDEDDDTPGTTTGGGSSGPTRYTVSAPSVDNGRVALSSNRASKGSTVTLTVTPDEGYELAALTVTDAAGNVLELTDRGDGRYAFTMPAGQVEIHAEFREIAGPEPVQLPYADVAQGAWYYDAVAYAYENGLMEGVGGGSFAPAMTTSRSMLATLLYRLEGAPDLSGEILGYPYADVDAESWYGDAVYWARLNGVVTGVGDGSAFDPDGDITREQMAVMLYRYAQYKGYDVSQGGMAAREFADYGQVADWARYAMDWAVAAGLITGTSGDTLSPQGSATRAEIAAILMRFAEKYVSAE